MVYIYSNWYVVCTSKFESRVDSLYAYSPLSNKQGVWNKRGLWGGFFGLLHEKVHGGVAFFSTTL